MSENRIEVVTGNKDLRKSLDRGDLDFRKDLPVRFHAGDPVLPANPWDRLAGQRAHLIGGICVPPALGKVGNLDADRAGVEAFENTTGIGIFPFGFPRMPRRAVTGPALEDLPVAVHDEVGEHSIGFLTPSLDRGLRTPAGRVMDDKKTAGVHRGPAFDFLLFGRIQPMVHDLHGDMEKPQDPCPE